MTTKRVELVGKKDFAATIFDPEYETYVVYVASLSSTPLIVSLESTLLDVHSFRRPQIFGLIAEKAPTKVSNTYANFVNIFSLDLASKIPKNTGINNHAIKLVNGQQPPYRLIYNLGAVELETLKTYIEINLANSFIRSFKYSAGAPILFDRKSDGFF